MAKRTKQGGGGFQAMIDAQRQKIAKVDTSEEKEKPKSAEEMLQEVLASAVHHLMSMVNTCISSK